MARILPILDGGDDKGASARRPFLVRMLDQLVPSLITAIVMGFIALKLTEYKVDNLTVRDAEQQGVIYTNSKDIVRIQERQAALAERSNEAIQRIDLAIGRMDDRLVRIEERARREAAR